MPSPTVRENAPAIGQPVPEPATRRRRATLANLWQPLIAFFAGWSLVALRTPGGWSSVFDPATFNRRDSGHYLSIARHGYRATTNCIGMGPDVHLCGNVTWFPGYPGLIRAVAAAGAQYATAALIISWICWYLTLVMVWVLSAGSRTPQRWACLALAAFFPGQIYFAAIFPISLVTFAMLLCVYCVTHRAESAPLRSNAAMAFGTGFLAAAAYPLAVSLLPGLGVAALSRRSRELRLTSLAAASGVLVSVAAVLSYAQLAVGKWNAYFITEREEYGVRARNPFATMLARYHDWQHGATSALRITTAQGLLVSVIVVFTIGWYGAVLTRMSARRRADQLLTRTPSRRRADQLLTRTPARPRVDVTDLALLVTAAAAWLLPYIGGGDLSVYRSEACLIVLVPASRRMPIWLVSAAALVAATIAYEMAPLFFQNALV